jgi:hypothetical protein
MTSSPPPTEPSGSNLAPAHPGTANNNAEDSQFLGLTAKEDETPQPKQTGAIDINQGAEDTLEQLPPKPSPPLKRHRDFIHCTPPEIPVYRKYSVFLAGSIEMGKAIPWQQRMADYLEDQPITVCNPRRGNWDPNITPREKDEGFRLQVRWELSALENVSVICFFFDKATKSPVTMLELGLWAKSEKVVVCCDDDFHKAGNVHITCERYGIPYVKKFTDLVPLVKKMLGEKGMRLNQDNDVVDEQGNVVENNGPMVKNFDAIKTGIKDRNDAGEQEKPAEPHQSRPKPIEIEGNQTVPHLSTQSQMNPTQKSASSARRTNRLTGFLDTFRSKRHDSEH